MLFGKLIPFGFLRSYSKPSMLSSFLVGAGATVAVAGWGTNGTG